MAAGGNEDGLVGVRKEGRGDVITGTRQEGRWEGIAGAREGGRGDKLKKIYNIRKRWINI